MREGPTQRGDACQTANRFEGLLMLTRLHFLMGVFAIRTVARALMKTGLSLLPSVVVLACANARYATDSGYHVGQTVAPCADMGRDTSVTGVTPDYDKCGYWHLGEIHAICANTLEGCPIKDDLKEIDNCESIEGKCAGADKLLKDIFQGTRHTHFANYIIYFDQDHTPGTFHDDLHRAVLMWNKKNTRYLYGVNEVYILVFSEYKFCISAQATTIFRNEPNPLLPLLKLLGRDTGIGETQVGLKAQRPATFIWYPLSGDPGNPIMWLAIGNVATDVNTTDWITVRFMQPIARPDKTEDPVPAECVLNPLEPITPYRTESVLAHNVFFSDNRASRGGLAVAFGATFPRRKLASLGVADPTFDGFVLAKYYVRTPTLRSDPNTAPGLLQYQRPSLGIGIGTNIGFGSSSSFNQVVGVVSVGHLLLRSNVGAVAGVSYFLPPKPTTPPDQTKPDLTKRHLRPFVGIEYSF